VIVFTHTEVDPSLEGQGIGGALVRGALDHVRNLGLRVLPICPFVQAWMKTDVVVGDGGSKGASSPWSRRSTMNEPAVQLCEPVADDRGLPEPGG
jgi:GNAT superfamily N-acetyltransferase